MPSLRAITISFDSVSKAMQSTSQPCSSSVFAGVPWRLPVIESARTREVVLMYKAVTLASGNSRPVIGSSDSKTVRCFVPLSWMKSPRTTVTAPFPKPTANCVRSFVTVNAETGKFLRAFCTVRVQRHFGWPVFLSAWSRYQTFNCGSWTKSSANVRT